MRRLLTVLVAVLVPSLALASPVHVTSHHRRLRVRGDRADYLLVRAGSPMTFDVTGPARVELRVRQVFHRGMRPGRTVTRVALSEDGARLRTFYVREPDEGRWFHSRIGGRPSRARTLGFDAPAGTHRYALSVAPRGRELAVAPTAHGAAGASPLALVPLVPLGHTKPPAHPATAQATPGIPLVGLVPPGHHPKPAPAATAETDEASSVPLVGLTPPSPAHKQPPAGTAENTGNPKTGAVAMNTGHTVQVNQLPPTTPSDESAPPLAPPETPFHRPPPGKIVVALRAALGTHGIGGGTVGGGAGVRMHTGLLGGHLALGLSVDVVPYGLDIQYTAPTGAALNATGSVTAVPILAVAALTQPLGEGRFSLEVTAGVGLVYASATVARRTGAGVAPGGEVSLGLLVDAGPGSFALALRGAGGWGSLAPTSGADRSTVLSGPLGELGFIVGYELNL